MASRNSFRSYLPFCLQIIRRLSLELDHPEKENGKRREGQKPDRPSPKQVAHPVRLGPQQAVRPSRSPGRRGPSFIPGGERTIHETVVTRDSPGPQGIQGFFLATMRIQWSANSEWVMKPSSKGM